MNGGLIRRTVVASGLLALLVGAAFTVLFVSISHLRASARQAARSETVRLASERLQGLVIDLETGQRGFVITREERFLDPWRTARASVPAAGRSLERLAAGSPEQATRAHRITAAIASYIREYSVPVVNAARRNEPSARSVLVTDQGRRRVDAIRDQFARFAAVEQALTTRRQQRAETDARRAVVLAGSVLAGSMLLIVIFGAYLTRAIVLPVRHAADMAGRLAGGDLAVRMPATGAGEIGDLQRAFNTMGSSLEVSRDELRLLAEEQAALRSVATLVAQGVSPTKSFDAVAAEIGRLLDADSARLVRYEPDGTAIVVAEHSKPGIGIAVGTRLTFEGKSIGGSVLRSGHAERIESYEDAPGPIAALARELGVRSAVGAPVIVEGRLWGVMVALWRGEQPVSEGPEERMAQFTELVATAIANADSRAELTASRARIVATADETRRRIERDLHDGTQQRLVSLGLELRAAEATVPPGLDELAARLSRTAKGLAGAVEDLQEISRGIHPAILSKGGLGPALKTLARRSAVPVELDVHAVPRLPEPVEVAAYYVVSEALTNVAKHAHASVVHVDLDAEDSIVQLTIRDDGVGGAAPGEGSGLVGLRDRIEALGGRIDLTSPPGSGTSMVVKIPIGGG